MTAILEIPEVRQHVSTLSVEEYHQLNEFNDKGRRTELIRGIILEKMSKTPIHRNVCSRLYKLLLAALPPGHAVWKEEPLTLADSEPEPDLAVTLGDEAAFARTHPSTAELVIEVAVTSPALDRANASLYAEAGVKEYWIILGHTRQAEVYRNPREGRYLDFRLYGPEDTIDCAALPAVKIRLAELFG